MAEPQRDIDHDDNLAATATWQARRRIDAGEDELAVIVDIIEATARAYHETPRVCWHRGLLMFMSHGAAANWDYLTWQDQQRNNER